MITLPWNALLTSLEQTVVMTAAAGAISFVIGLPLGLVLVGTAPGGIWEHRAANKILGAVVNCFRSLPFIILLVALIPVTRLIVGTSIGTAAAIVPLSISAIPYFGRVSENALREVDRGLIDAVKAMGGGSWSIIRDVLVPELQRRGRYKQAYAPGTLREKLFGAGPRLAPPHPAAGYRWVSGDPADGRSDRRSLEPARPAQSAQ